MDEQMGSMRDRQSSQMDTTSESRVLTCMAEQCSYNCGEACCAPTIEVGDEHPACDTFTTGEVTLSRGEPQIQDCKVSECHYNGKQMCHAPGITLMTHWGHADCATYRA